MKEKNSKLPKVLTIAGSDSGGGAGIQADLKTFTVLGCYGMSVITAVTAQNTIGILGIHPISVDIIEKQIIAVMEDIGADVIKTGMLWNADIINVVANTLKKYSFKYLVVDPVLVAKSGDILLKRESVETLKKELLPMAWIVTPNIPELEEISGKRIEKFTDLINSVEEILSLGSKYVLVKGGHTKEEMIVDRLFSAEGKFCEFPHPRIDTNSTHGTGCTLSSAIACYLAYGYDTSMAVSKAIEFVWNAIKTAPSIGKGHGPLNHLWQLPSE